MQSFIPALLLLTVFSIVKSYRNFLADAILRKKIGSRFGTHLSASGTLFESDECITLLGRVGGNKGKLEAILKSQWQRYGIQSLQMTKKALSTYGDSDLNQVVSELVDNLSRRNEQATIKLLGPSLAKNYMISLPPEAKRKKGSGRSEVVDLYGLADGITYKGKIVKEKLRIEREIDGFCKVSGMNPNTIGDSKQNAKRYSSFVSIVDRDAQILVLERGIENLRSLREVFGPLKGAQLRTVMKAMASSVAQVHSRGQVWCDIKLENFVVIPSVKDGLYPVDSALNSIDCTELLKSCSIKAIDLESVTGKGRVMTDFAPETVAPELVAQLTSGLFGTVGSRDKDIRINPQSEILASQSSDVFSLGLSWVELASTAVRGPILGSVAGKSFARVSSYVEGGDDLGLNGISDAKVKQLVTKMLDVDPSKRPTMLEVQLRLNLV